MNHTWLPYALTLGATLSFSSSSLIFAHYSRRVSVFWMNTLKASVALALLTVTLPLLYFFTGVLDNATLPTLESTLLLLLSGALGLGIGDLFLLDAFTRLGVSRTLILYGFQPIALGIAGVFIFGQSFDIFKVAAIVCLIGCLVIFSLEHYRENNRWELRGLIFAIIGVSLDSGGVLLTRRAFDLSPGFHPLEGHFVRCVGALFCYALLVIFIWLRRSVLQKKMTPDVPVIGLVSNFLRFDSKSRKLLFLGCFGGTYLSLCLYLTAIQIGHLASISAIAITGPMFAALLETLILKKRPSRYLIAAFSLFILGFSALLKA